MVRRMFEEYKFFPGFPEKELRITGQLFGGIIDQGLVPWVYSEGSMIIIIIWSRIDHWGVINQGLVYS